MYVNGRFLNHNLLFSILLLLALSSTAIAQKIDFAPGLYLSPTSIKNNKPDYTLEEVVIKEGKTKKRKLLTSSWFFNAAPTEEYEEHLQSVLIKKIIWEDSLGEKINIPQETVMAIANEAGIYFRIDQLYVKAGVQGPICHIPLQQLNTATYIDRPIDRNADKIKHHTEQYLYKLATGELVPFDEENVKTMISDDQKLLTHFEKNQERSEKLYLYVLKYNERNGLPNK